MGSNRNLHWYIVIKHTDFDFVGVRVDAHYVSEAQEAMLRTSRGPMRPGEKLKSFRAMNEIDRKAAVELHDSRMLENREWMCFVDQMESAWQKAAMNGQSK